MKLLSMFLCATLFTASSFAEENGVHSDTFVLTKQGIKQLTHEEKAVLDREDAGRHRLEDEKYASLSTGQAAALCLEALSQEGLPNQFKELAKPILDKRVGSDLYLYNDSLLQLDKGNMKIAALPIREWEQISNSKKEKKEAFRLELEISTTDKRSLGVFPKSFIPFEARLEDFANYRGQDKYKPYSEAATFAKVRTITDGFEFTPIYKMFQTRFSDFFEKALANSTVSAKGEMKTSTAKISAEERKILLDNHQANLLRRLLGTANECRGFLPKEFMRKLNKEVDAHPYTI